MAWQHPTMHPASLLAINHTSEATARGCQVDSRSYLMSALRVATIALFFSVAVSSACLLRSSICACNISISSVKGSSPFVWRLFSIGLSYFSYFLRRASALCCTSKRLMLLSSPAAPAAG
eukprot:GHRR01034016.1.p1 GENE.GHRR01034016.1~~GHRR01034016.1.p1  ORF type:complete len:120 (-),score=17.86 GHRR01034016.1:161-520(-)